MSARSFADKRVQFVCKAWQPRQAGSLLRPSVPATEVGASSGCSGGSSRRFSRAFFLPITPGTEVSVEKIIHQVERQSSPDLTDNKPETAIGLMSCSTPFARNIPVNNRVNLPWSRKGLVGRHKCCLVGSLSGKRDTVHKVT